MMAATEASSAASAEITSAAGARGDVGSLPSCRLRRVTDYVQQNLDKDLTLAELAAVLYMSPFHFARLFKCSTGVPPHRFVVRQRITRARTCLAMEGQSIAQISKNSIGYINCIIIYTIAGMFVGQVRTLQRFGWLANLAVWLNLLIMFIV